MALDMAAVLPLRKASTIRNLRTDDSSDVVFSGEEPRTLDRDAAGGLSPAGSRDGIRLTDILELRLRVDC